MNGIGCGIIGRKVGWDIAGGGDIGPIIDPQRFEFLNQNLVRPHFLLGEFYGVKPKREPPNNAEIVIPRIRNPTIDSTKVKPC